MNNETCVLTTKDFTIAEVMLDRCLDNDRPLASILTRKIASAIVMFRDDVPEDVATMSSRVTFSVDGRDPDTRVISHDPSASSTGMFLPVTTLRGIALLGLKEGGQFVYTNREGLAERIVLEKVHYQPEAARREKEQLDSLFGRVQARPKLTLVRGTLDARDSVGRIPGGYDDPGPSAA